MVRMLFSFFCHVGECYSTCTCFRREQYHLLILNYNLDGEFAVKCAYEIGLAEDYEEIEQFFGCGYESLSKMYQTMANIVAIAGG